MNTIEQAREVSARLRGHSCDPYDKNPMIEAADTIDALIAEVEANKIYIRQLEDANTPEIQAQRKVLEQAREALTTASRRFELLAAHDDATHNGAKPSAGYNDCQTAITAVQEQLS